MEFKKRLKEAALKENIEYINAIPFDFDGYNCVIAGLIPYYAGEHKSYFSKYTRGKDYHVLGREIFARILNRLDIRDYKIYVDVSPHNEREIALKAGLGVQGKNGLVINEKYGSYVFIVTAFIKLYDTPQSYPVKNCISCGICMETCPQKAIEENRINYERCLSNITQKKHINAEEESSIRRNGSAWGCHVCQEVCPLNKGALITPIRELKEELLTEINDIDSLSNKEFKQKYGHYALSYKGKSILKRNINLIK